MVDYSHQLKIPKERIAVLIGVKGQTKKELEEISNTKINIDSKEGDVNISGSDSLDVFQIKEVIIAIGRGFNPDLARVLLKSDYGLEVINMMDYAHRKEDIPRVKGRVIGTEGKSRLTIETLTETNISVYGKTISIIGSIEYLPNAKRAIEMLLEGSAHATVYRWLERKRREMRGFVPEVNS
jgi:ribosomal RNA assembly protein